MKKTTKTGYETIFDDQLKMVAEENRWWDFMGLRQTWTFCSLIIWNQMKIMEKLDELLNRTSKEVK